MGAFILLNVPPKILCWVGAKPLFMSKSTLDYPNNLLWQSAFDNQFKRFVDVVRHRVDTQWIYSFVKVQAHLRPDFSDSWRRLVTSWRKHKQKIWTRNTTIHFYSVYNFISQLFQQLYLITVYLKTIH